MTTLSHTIKHPAPARPQTVTVDGTTIARAAIARELQNHPAGTAQESWLAAARALVIRELLLNEARRLDIAATPLEDGERRRETEDEAMIRTLVEQQVVTPTADEAACRVYFNNNRRRFRSAELLEVRHILLAAAADDAPARSRARRDAEAILAELGQDPGRFATLAAAFSACPSAALGGNLGQIGPGQTVAEFERALGAIAAGTFAPAPVETRYGLHIVAVDRRIEGRDLPFELVRERIAEWLDERVRRAAIRQYIAILAGRAEITGVDLEASASPLVQ